jgi:glycine/D-amino acid oxidase-like deaminating enzyme
VQPARLALGLRGRLREAGVEICERSPVRSLRDEGGEVEARTAAGSVRAGAAVVAIGGAAKSPRGPLRNAVTVTSSHIVLTEPVPDLLEEIGWTGGECITDCRTMLHYFRTTPDGRIAFGLGGGRISMGGRLRGRTEVDPEVAAEAAERLHAYFPGVAGRELTHAWGGPIDVSPTHLPFVAPLAGGRAFAAAGYTGNGVGPSHMVGRVLASLALDRRDEHSRLPIVEGSPQRVPPEPFHWLGGTLIRAGIMSKERAEAEGRTPNPVSRALARVPELIGFHIGR